MGMPDFESLFTPSGAVMFTAGFMVRRAWCSIKNRILDRKHPEEGPHRERLKTIVMGWGIVLTGMLYLGVQAQVAHNDTVKQASSAEQIAHSLAWDQYFAGQERCALTGWLALVVNPPQDIFNLHTTDPKYQEWARGVNQDYLNKLDSIGAQRTREAAEHPHNLPPKMPTCAL